MRFKSPPYHTLWDRLHETGRYMQVISGPRQTGKTTLVFQLMEELDMPYHYGSADHADSGGSAWIQQQWETARLKVQNSEQISGELFFDEIHRIDQWGR